MVLQRFITAEEFDQYVRLPENAARNFELIAGEIVEKMVSHPRSSSIGALMTGVVALFVRQNGLGRVTGADGGYVVAGERYIPDTAYISKARQPMQPAEAHNPLAPENCPLPRSRHNGVGNRPGQAAHRSIHKWSTTTDFRAGRHARRWTCAPGVYLSCAGCICVENIWEPYANYFNCRRVAILVLREPGYGARGSY